jgi:DNA-binding LacI/PurR family transcriptional regulator
MPPVRSPRTRLEDIAALAGVSIATASRALNNSPAVAHRTKLAIWRLAREHGYPLPEHLPFGPIGATATIAVVIPQLGLSRSGLHYAMLLELLAGITDAARDRNCDVLISHAVPSGFAELQDIVAASQTEGLIFLGGSPLHDSLNRLAQGDARFVAWGAEAPGQAYCSIGSDNVLGGRRATLHLARLGRRRIMFLGERDAPESRQRHAGYVEALEVSGLGPEAELTAPCHVDVEAAEAAVAGLLARGVRFDAIVAVNDEVALGALRALHAAGARVPDDVALVGYDDLPFARLSRPALTTIAQDAAKGGRLLVNKLLSLRGGDEVQSERLPTDLIVRESCGA